MGKQQEIPGYEAPKNADIEQAIDLWLDAKEEAKRAAETTKLRHATLLLHMQQAGLDVYPFVDPKNGKKRQVVIARDPKAKTLKQPRWNRRDDDADIGAEVEVRDAADMTPLNSDSPPADDEPATDNVVEMRRVKRTAAHDAVIDPFASTRAAMDGDWQVGETRGASPDGGVAMDEHPDYDTREERAMDTEEPPPKRKKGKAK